ncbi:MAG TPA: biotin/lipoyl-containing protein, partial [Gammaproteobacteria bacterium]|nr:biotin/lipoyl-containing protein [Gammaproteobacteria bacterium]
MSIEVKVPQLPESVTDATLVAWHKKAGDPVRRDENLVDLETDKVVLEVPSPTDGILREIKVQDGATVTSGQLLAVLEPGQAVQPAQSARVAQAAPAGSPVAAAQTEAAARPAAEETSREAARETVRRRRAEDRPAAVREARRGPAAAAR